MPRRRGRERYRTKAQALRDVRRTYAMSLDPSFAATGGKRVQNAPAGGLLCRCGVPWTTCTSCSTTVQRSP